MPMTDWVVVNFRDPTNPTPNGMWVYKTNPHFPGLHFSFSVDNPMNNHVGTDAPPASSYYYGASTGGAAPHFAGAVASAAAQTMLINAWNDYYTV